MSKVNQVAATVGHSPRAGLNSSLVQSFWAGATSDLYHAAKKAEADQAVIDTMVELGFDEKTAARIQAGE
jgi:hypothetical protein